MTARHWMEIAVLASALGLTGTAVAETTYGTTSSDVGFSYGADTPSSGAIVTPQDRAAGMGREDEDARNRNADADDDASNDTGSYDDETLVNPEASNDEGASVDPRYPNIDEDSPRYTAPAMRAPVTDDSASVPPRTGSDARPGDMGPGSVRSQ